MRAISTSGYRLYRRHRPDVVIVDLAMQGSGLGGIDLIRRIRSHDPRARILVFSMHSDPIIVARALEAGATGYVLKDTSSDELIEGVRAGARRHALSEQRYRHAGRAGAHRRAARIRSPT